MLRFIVVNNFKARLTQCEGFSTLFTCPSIATRSFLEKITSPSDRMAYSQQLSHNGNA